MKIPDDQEKSGLSNLQSLGQIQPLSPIPIAPLEAADDAPC